MADFDSKRVSFHPKDFVHLRDKGVPASEGVLVNITLIRREKDKRIKDFLA